jgi:hypothetical protein
MVFWVADSEKTKRGARLRLVREDFATGREGPFSQGDFAAELQRVAVELFGAGEVEHKYGQSLVNRLEKGNQPPTLQDLDVYAAIDPKKRAREWFAWGDRKVLDLSHAKPVSEAAQKRAVAITERGSVKDRPATKRPRTRHGGSGGA